MHKHHEQMILVEVDDRNFELMPEMKHYLKKQ
jgi:hypothetical protein